MAQPRLLFALRLGGRKGSGSAPTLAGPLHAPGSPTACPQQPPAGLCAPVWFGALRSSKKPAEWAGLGGAVPGVGVGWGCGHAPPRPVSLQLSGTHPLHPFGPAPTGLRASPPPDLVQLILRAPLRRGGGRVPPPWTPPGEGGTRPAGAYSPPPPPPPSRARPESPVPPAGFLLPLQGNTRSLIYGRSALCGERAPLLSGAGMFVRKRLSSPAVVDLEPQESVRSHQFPPSRSLSGRPPPPLAEVGRPLRYWLGCAKRGISDF